MKIGILTFHCAHNYGAVLQTYALQEFLRERGNEVYVIDYRPEYLTKQYRESLLSSIKEIPIPSFIKHLVMEPFIGPHLRCRYNKFDNFISDYLNLKPYNNPELSEYDAVILGSDQIWSPNITGDKFDDNYFASKAECRIISYAASSNLSGFSEIEKSYLKSQLSRFYAISVREKSLCLNLSKFVTSNITTVVDPTLLAGAEVFEKIIVNSKRRNEDYVLCFELNPYKEVREISVDIARQLHSKVVYLAGYPYPNRIFNSITDISPSEMLRLVRDARCIVTSSFHGSCFSLIFGRPFYVVRKGNSGDARFVSMLEDFGIKERMINKYERPVFSGIDYTKVTESMNKFIHNSRSFLETALQ